MIRPRVSLVRLGPGRPTPLMIATQGALPRGRAPPNLRTSCRHPAPAHKGSAMFRTLAAAAVFVLLACVLAAPAQDKDKPRQKPIYEHGPDSKEQDDVPKGKEIQMPKWKSKVFEGTERDWWVYVPDQYDGKTAACVMVFQDGGSYVNRKGDFRVPIVFDNLIHQKKMPVTIGIFLNPGRIPPATKDGK